MSVADKSEHSKPRQAFALAVVAMWGLIVAGGAAMLVGAVFVADWMMSEPSVDAGNVAIEPGKHPELWVREYAGGSWSPPRPWTGAWSEISAETSRVMVSAAGFVPELFEVARYRDQRLPDLKQMAVLSIAVHGPGRSVVAGEAVTARRTALGEYPQELADLAAEFRAHTPGETADSGVIEFHLIPDVVYEVSLPDRSVEQLGILTRFREVTLHAGERRSMAFMPLSADDALIGWLRTRDGEPCGSARVALRSWQQTSGVSITQDLMVTRTGPNGAFVLEGRVPTAAVQVEAGADDPKRHALWVEWKPYTGAVLRGRFAVEAWAGIQEIGALTLPENVTIEIRAIQNGKPLPGANVKLWVNEELELEVLTDDMGKATFVGLPRGFPAECLVEAPSQDRKRADVSHLMAGGGSIDVELAYTPGVPAGTVTFTFDRRAHGFADNEVLTLRYQIHEPGVPSRKWAGGGEKLSRTANSTAVVGPPGEYLFWIGTTPMMGRPRKLTSIPQRVRLNAGDVHAIKCEFFEWAELIVETDISDEEAAVFAGVRTPDRLTIMGDAELTGTISPRRATIKYYVPPHGDYILEAYAEPRGVERSSRTRKWHRIELKPFKPGEVRTLKIERFWSD